jgi:hypothetical protein
MSGMNKKPAIKADFYENPREHLASCTIIWEVILY